MFFSVLLLIVEDFCIFCEEEFDLVSLVNIVVKFWWGEWCLLWWDVVIRVVGMWLVCCLDLLIFWKDMRWYNFESFDVLFDMFEEVKEIEGIVFEMLF